MIKDLIFLLHETIYVAKKPCLLRCVLCNCRTETVEVEGKRRQRGSVEVRPNFRHASRSAHRVGTVGSAVGREVTFRARQGGRNRVVRPRIL